MNMDQAAIMDTISTAEFWSVLGSIDMRIEPFSPDTLRALRKERGIDSQRELAELSGVPESTLKKLEAGMTEPGLGTLLKLGKFFGLFLYADWTKEKPPTKDGDSK